MKWWNCLKEKFNGFQNSNAAAKLSEHFKLVRLSPTHRKTQNLSVKELPTAKSPIKPNFHRLTPLPEPRNRGWNKEETRLQGPASNVSRIIYQIVVQTKTWKVDCGKKSIESENFQLGENWFDKRKGQAKQRVKLIRFLFISCQQDVECKCYH